MGVWVVGEALCVRQGAYGNSLCFLLNFAVNLKLLYNTKSIISFKGFLSSKSVGKLP